MNNHNYKLLSDAVKTWEKEIHDYYNNRNKVYWIKPKYYLIFFGISLLFILATSNGKEKPKSEDPAAFQTFIKDFTSDPQYQSSHIKFPVKAIGFEAEPTYIQEGRLSLPKIKDAIIHGKKEVFGDECEGVFIRKSDDEYVYELIRTADLKLIRRFTFMRINKKWLLVEIEKSTS